MAASLLRRNPALGGIGAALIDRHAEQFRLVAIDDSAILVDVDTPAALAELRRRGGADDQ